MERIINLASQWEMGGTITREEATLIFDLLEPYLEYEFELISELTKTDPETALAELTKMTNFFSAAANVVPGIVTRLQKSIRKYQGHAQRLGQHLGAETLTISVGFPSGVTVSLSWMI